ncbi:MAG: hypothetical protein KGZ49_05355 [Syntrophaceae bacterium]|nr:hypothetical protein [Syntrophaceae bacterium]
MLSQIIHFINTGIWEIRLKDLHPIKAFFVKYLRVIILASRGFLRDHCQKTASVLTYYSLLNIVPVIAVAFAISKGFGLEKLIEKQIFHLVTKKFSQGEKALNAIEIAEQLEIPVRFVRQLLQELIDVGLVVEITSGTKDQVVFQPGRTIENLTVKEVLDAYERRGIPYDTVSQSDKEENISNYLQNISEVVEKAPGNVLIKKI